jgi:predicted glycogen debranching enzyme
MLALAALDLVVLVGERRIRCATHKWPGAVDPRGYELLSSFDLDDGVPRWRYDLGEVQVELEVATGYGTSVVAVVHRLLAGRARLEVTALCTWRDQHGERFGGQDLRVDADATGFVVESAYRVEGPGLKPLGVWYRNDYHREEAARGLGATEDLWAAGVFAADLEPGQSLGVTASTSLQGPLPPAEALVSGSRSRSRRLAEAAGATDDVERLLVRAADQLVVTTPTGPTAVAGYPWFGEWSRDLFTSYEGLFLCTGRVEEGRQVLRRAASTVSQGMLANTADTGTPEYNTIDATLWFLTALGRHLEATGDDDLAAELADVVLAILRAHRDGTRYGIGVDAGTGLLRGGADGVALTWMDARIDGRPVTQRAGMPVEIQALWVSGLASAADLLARAGRSGEEWQALRVRATTSFGEVFPITAGGLPDVVGPEGGVDRSVRPNQLLAVSLPHAPVCDPDDVARVLATCRRELSTSLGLRSLSPRDPAYLGRHRGSSAQRDAAYHQGTIWPWLIGPYVDAALRLGAADGFPLDTALDGLELHLHEAGLGSVSETADGDAPHGTTGCPFQAWSVAELLRARRRLHQTG